jgi:hypothetical protein
MNTKPALARPHLGMTIVAAALSFVIAIGLLVAVAALFVQEGAPLQNVAIADRACSKFAVISEREACVQSLLGASYHGRLASR